MVKKSLLKLIITDFLLSVATFIVTLVGPLIASSIVALLCKRLGWDGRPASFWILMSPVLYLIWLICLLGFYTLETTLFGLFYQKPRRYDLRQKKGRLAFGITLLLYGHAFTVASLPMIRVLGRSQFFVWLILRSYSTRISISHGGWPGGEVSDPDITTFGDGIVLGDDCHIIAHAINRTSEGSLQYLSAPIELQDRCTIGGGARVEMGAIIGAGSLVEPHSRVQPFTRIPPGEVWGGSPAVFLRKRDSVTETPLRSIPAPARTVASADVAKLHQLIAEALELPAGQITPETSAKNCPVWDSTGRMAIAAALHDRFGLDLPPETIEQLNSVSDVEKALAGASGPKAPADASPLSTDPELLPLLDPARVLAALADQVDASDARRKKIRVVIAATFIAPPLASALRLYSRAFGLEAEVEFFDFNQVPQALLSPESPLRKNRAGLNVVLVRPEDWPGEHGSERKVIAGQFLEAIKNFAATSGCALLASDLPPAISPGLQHLRQEISELQSWWRQQLNALGNVEILPFAEIIEDLGMIAARPSPTDGDAALPLSPAVYQRLGIGITRTLRKMTRAPKKVLALDADNTLWGGIIGEDGPDGIQLGDDATGQAFKALQSGILALKQRGVLLALVSKNSPDDVWNLVDNHPQMILRRQDFAAARINWQPKSENLRALADELNLGLDSIVLLDDSPAERLEVELNCPPVTVIPLPARPEHYAEMLSRLWCFDGAGDTAEDEKRNDYAGQENLRQQFEQQSGGGLEAYLQALELKVTMHRAREEDLPRVSQLLLKTNQFNLSLKRRTLPEMRALLPGHDIWVASVRDRFGDYGLVGVCITRPENGSLVLDSLLMSCRALGRGAEAAFLHGITRHARTAGCHSLRGEFVPGPRNQPMQQFLEKSGFTLNPDGNLCKSI